MATEATASAPWLVEARKFVGLKEIIGSRHEAKILQFFAEAGHAGVKDDETAWCAAFVGAMLRRAGYGSSGALNARSYLNFGTKLDKPTPGCIVVFKRGNSAWQGHVGFVDRVLPDGALMVTGGNQGNAVSTARFGTGDLLGYRWPLIKSAPAAKPKPTPVKEAAKVVTGAAAGGSVVVATGAAVEAGWSVGEIALLILAMLVLAGLAYGAWRWWQARKATPQEIASDAAMSSRAGDAGLEAVAGALEKPEPSGADDIAASIAAAAKARTAVAKAAESETRPPAPAAAPPAKARRKPKKAATVKRRAARSVQKRRAS